MYNFKEIEENISVFWKQHSTIAKVREKNKGKKKFYFLDGPPYTSGKVHIGTAWNKSLKDMVLRYKRMRGCDVWDRAGYDMHGLPIEHQVEKKFKLKTKEDIQRFGVAKFVEECEKFAVQGMLQMNEDFRRLGVWMDFDNAYQTAKPEFMEGVWTVIKHAYTHNRLYEGKRAMYWCASCATALAKHELEYSTIKDPSIYVKLKVKGSPNEFLIVWTTTPWTIKFNMGVMVHPEVTYVKAQVDNEVWIVAEPLAKSVIEKAAHKTFKILEKVCGKQIEGMEYLHPCEDLIPHYKELRKTAKIHRVILSAEYVDTESGTGLVHTAPGCGPEDYEIGIRAKLPIFNNLDDYGIFPHDMGPFKDMKAKRDDAKIIEILDKQGAVVASEMIDHEYAHCQRCHQPIIYKTTKQWFLKVEDLKEKMIKDNTSIKWEPQAAFNAFESWLKNLRDNSITKQRYWGTPLPIWRCTNCEAIEVFGSIKELEKRSGKKIKQLHKPWIDDVGFDCKECKYPMKRSPDVVDVWVDAGSASWACLDYPRRQDTFRQLFPADFITEGQDQIRGWFNLLMVLSELKFGKPAFKSVYMHGFINDAQGRKMSKSLGNYILPEEVISKYGVDTFRYYVLGGASPGLDLNYNFEDMKVKFRNLGILFNLANLVSLYAKDVKKEYQKDIEERYILSKLHSSIKNVTNALDNLKLNEVPQIIEELYLELSRSYVQFTRDKIADEPEKVASTIAEVLVATTKLFSIVVPFITEHIYQELRKSLNLKEESIHIHDWPTHDERLINVKLEKGVGYAKQIIQELLAQREKGKIGVRWPLAKATITTENEEIIEAIRECERIILAQVNVRKIEIKKKATQTSFEAHLDMFQTPELEKEGYVRELTRKIQNIRKKMGLNKQDQIILTIKSTYPLKGYEPLIQSKVGAKKILFSDPNTAAPFHTTEKIKDQVFEVFIDRTEH